jgi:hypothetical protein
MYSWKETRTSPDYSLAYSALARRVSAANALINARNLDDIADARKELAEAMKVIKQMETKWVVVPAQVENTTAGADNEAARSIPDFDNRGLLPMIVSETGEDSEPEIERIICSSISGGSDYINEMPREVSLHRIFADGRTISARYIQITTDCALTPRSEND